MMARATAPVALILLWRREMLRKEEMRTARAVGRVVSGKVGMETSGRRTESLEGCRTKGAVVETEGDETGSGCGWDASGDVLDRLLVEDVLGEIEEMESLCLRGREG